MQRPFKRIAGGILLLALLLVAVRVGREGSTSWNPVFDELSQIIVAAAAHGANAGS